MPAIESRIDVNGEAFARNRAHMLALIVKLRALEARHTNLKTLEEVAKNQDLIDPAPNMVQHLTPKGSYAMNNLPSGK